MKKQHAQNRKQKADPSAKFQPESVTQKRDAEDAIALVHKQVAEVSDAVSLESVTSD